MRTWMLSLARMALLAGWSGSAWTSQPHRPPIEAVWQPQQVEFRAATSYSCSGLRDRVRTILVRLGARSDLKVIVLDCDDTSLSPRVRAIFASPVVADEATVRRLTTYDERQKLVARTHGATLPSATDLERFRAEWDSISFARDVRMKLRPGDCELVRQIRQEIVPRLAVKVVRDGGRCSIFGNISSPRLTVDALIAARD